ncbi:MAG: hypothetical protein Q9217_006028, partial [Psora testacea]
GSKILKRSQDHQGSGGHPVNDNSTYTVALLLFELETTHCREDIDKLSVHELQAFVRSRVSNRLTRNRTELLRLAQEAWNKPRALRSNAVAPGELQDRAGFDKLTRDGLCMWIKISEWTRANASMNRADLIDIARRIQSYPALVRSPSLTFDKVRSREDLSRLSKASLQKWILSRGYTVDTLTIEAALNHPYTVWDHIKGVVGAHGAKGNSSPVEIKKISSARKKAKKVKNGSELSSMKKVQLFDAIVFHELVVPGNYRHKKKDKSVVLELAENVWDYLKDGRPLPDLLRIRTRLNVIQTWG